MIAFTRPKKSSLGLDMAPLIDCIFQLLIFFMLTSSFSNPAFRLDLPEAGGRDSGQPESIVVSVDRLGQVAVNTQKTTLEQLRPTLEEELVKAPKKALHLKGDQEMPYKIFVQVIDLARQAGVRQIHIVHESPSAGRR